MKVRTGIEDPQRAEDLHLRTSDHVDLDAWRYRAQTAEPRAGVVLVHGFVGRGSSSVLVGHARVLAREGFDVVAYDARGHGGSGGACSLGALERHDVAAAIGALDRTQRTVLVGESAGGTAALGLAVDDPRVDAVVTVGAPSTWEMKYLLPTMGAAFVTRTPMGRWAAKRLLEVDIHPEWLEPETPASVVSRMAKPVAVIHGREDRFIPMRDALRIHREATGPCRLDLVHGMGHGFSLESIGPVRTAVGWCLDQVAAA